MLRVLDGQRHIPSLGRKKTWKQTKLQLTEILLIPFKRQGQLLIYTCVVWIRCDLSFSINTEILVYFVSSPLLAASQSVCVCVCVHKPPVKLSIPSQHLFVIQLQPPDKHRRKSLDPSLLSEMNYSSSLHHINIVLCMEFNSIE